MPYFEMHSDVLKVTDVLKRSKNVLSVVVYRSYARGWQDRHTTDIDMLAVVNRLEKKKNEGLY